VAVASIEESLATLEQLREPAFVATLVRAADVVATSLEAGGKLLLFGNGGSAADATHIAAEFLGRYLLERPSLPAISLSDNNSAVTAIGNDYAYAEVFSRQIAGLGREGDVAFAITTSGNSENVLEGVKAATERGLRTIGLTGGSGGRLADLVELCITVPSSATPRIQEGHTLIAHVICEIAELRLAARA
jgi:D-sedoheptulose 7-phosphate isomerase